MATGIYSMQSHATLITEMPAIKACGFDIVITSMSAEGYLPLDEALQNGLKLAVGLIHRIVNPVSLGPTELAYIATGVNAVKDHPAVFGWYIADEALLSDFPNADRTAAVDLIRSLDSKPIIEVHPGYGANFFPDARVPSPYDITKHDIFGVNNYPVQTNGSYNSTTFASQLTATYGSVDPADRLVHAMQVYGSPTYGLGLPTAAQLQSMVAVCVSTGWATRDLWYYCWGWDSLADATSIKTSSELQAAATAINESYQETLYDGGPTYFNGYQVADAIPVTDDTPETRFRIFDEDTIKYFPLVETDAANASPVRVDDGVQMWAVQSLAGNPVTRKSGFKFGFGFNPRV